MYAEKKRGGRLKKNPKRQKLQGRAIIKNSKKKKKLNK
jgi:hypothetical protein